MSNTIQSLHAKLYAIAAKIENGHPQEDLLKAKYNSVQNQVDFITNQNLPNELQQS